MQEGPIKLAIILGSNREGRFGAIVGEWFASHLEGRPDIEVAYIDVADLDLPIALPRDESPGLRDYLRRIDRADAFVIVTPETTTAIRPHSSRPLTWLVKSGKPSLSRSWRTAGWRVA